MRRQHSESSPATVVAVLVALLPAALLPGALAAAPQEGPEHEREQVHRELLVVGSRPAHRHVIVDRLAARGYLGVHLLNLTPELRLHFGAPEEAGVLVSRIATDSPAVAAGLAVGDVIVTADGEPVHTSSQLAGRIGHHQRGDEIELGIVRDRSQRTLSATLAESERRQFELGQFVWRAGDEEPIVADVDPEILQRVVNVDPEMIERVIAVDPEAINESISQLLERLEAQGGTAGLPRLDDDVRERLEKRIAELEKRLLEMERQLRDRHPAD
jgi:membrane-associated protease RseP (regulator of RpoE activity)